MALSRRQFVTRTTALLAATWGSPLTTSQWAYAQGRTTSMAGRPDGTTLAVSLAPTGSGPYFRLTEAPGWPFVVREELTTAQTGREDRRTALASIAQLSDVHVIDAQSPTRVEFLDRDADPPQQAVPFESAYRGQETLTTQVADAMIGHLRSIASGPVTGRTFDCAVSTGDNIDNQQQNELEWFISLLDGGNELIPNSGDPARYEGVQDNETAWYDTHYWHPDPTTDLRGPDNYRRFWGWPSYEGLLDAAIVGFTPVGIGSTPWYSCYGNHDGLLQGNVAGNEALAAISTGPLKVTGRPAGMTSGDVQQGFLTQDPTVIAALFASPARPITADPKRRFVAADEWIAMHRASASHPDGHGYTQANLDAGTLYFTFEIAPGVLGIVLDTVNRGGYAEGSIGRAQLDWLEAQLVTVSSRYHDASGAEVTQDADDHLVVLFSHHNSPTMENPNLDPADPTDERVLGAEFVAWLHRFPNVIAWINGHTHANKIWPRPSTLGGPGFWEINTAAHVDYPEHARIVEIVDNGDGTLSIFGTVVDHAGPAQAADGARDLRSLAAISRELAVNDPQRSVAGPLGEVTDRNVELLLTRPFTPTAVVAPPAPVSEPVPTPTLPTTGGGLGIAAVGAALAGAVALRERGTNRTSPDQP